MNTDDAARKKPGRPKKKIVSAPVDVQGIVLQPHNTDDIVELVYNNPMMFKKLMQLYKAYEVKEISFAFDAQGVRVVTVDHLNKSNIYTHIDGKCMNLYYCAEPIKIRVTMDNLDRVLNTLGKNHYKISIVLKHENYRSKMYMSIKDLEYDNDDWYEINVIHRAEGEQNAFNDNDALYPIRFKISSKHFKTRVNNVRKLSETFTIQKYGAGPLQFTFEKAKTVSWTGIYNDSEKIDLKSTLGDDESFAVSVPVDYIKPFSNSNIGDDVFIAADKRERMSFTTYLDKKEQGHSATVRVFTQIKDYKRAESTHE